MPFGEDLMKSLVRITESNVFPPRSYAFICGEPTKTQIKQYKNTKRWGERLDNDFLVRFETQPVKSVDGKRPKITFDYNDTQVNINYVELSVDVSSFKSCFKIKKKHSRKIRQTFNVLTFLMLFFFFFSIFRLI